VVLCLPKLTSLVEHDPHTGIQELRFVLHVVVGTQEQFTVPAPRDQHAEQHVGLGTAPIAAISRRKNERCHGMPPRKERANFSCIDNDADT
jgi:hypothetical protein